MEVTDKKRLKSGAVSLSNLPPTWQEDGFDNEQDHEKHYTKLVHSLFKQSVNEFYKEKAEWDKSEKLIQLEHIINSAIDSHPSKTRFPLLIKLIEEYVATRTADIMRPQASSRQPDMDQAVGALNYFKDVELDDNQYELKMVLKAMHQLRCKIAFMRTDVDPDEPGPFGHDGKHKISLVDPRCVWPDPYAKTWDWKEHAFVIISRPMDLSEIRRIWPGKGHLVQPDETFTYSDGQSQNQAANSQIVRNLMSSPTGIFVRSEADKQLNAIRLIGNHIYKLGNNHGTTFTQAELEACGSTAIPECLNDELKWNISGFGIAVKGRSTKPMTDILIHGNPLDCLQDTEKKVMNSLFCFLDSLRCITLASLVYFVTPDLIRGLSKEDGFVYC